MAQATHHPRLEGSGWFESKVSEAEFSRFKDEILQFKADMTEFKNTMTEFKQEIWEKLRRHAIMRMNDRDNITDLEKRVTKIENGSPYTSEEEDWEDEEEDEQEEDEEQEEEGLDSVSSSSTSDSGDSESDEQSEDDYDHRSYFKRRNDNSDGEF